jgi:hypothetical protein
MKRAGATINQRIVSILIDWPGIIRTLRNKEVQRMWDAVAPHEFPMMEAEEAFKISATQRREKILSYPHGLPSERGDV